MDQHWQSPFSNTVNHPTRSGGGGSIQVAPLQVGRDTGGQAQQHHISPSYDYDSYQSASAASNGLSMASTPSATSHSNDYNGETDVPMEDADPYNRSKYPSRPVHQRGSSSQYLTRQESSAAQRYSPMDLLSPSGYASSPKSQSQNSSFQYQSSASRQSPTRQNNFSNSSQHYQDSPSRWILSHDSCFDVSTAFSRYAANIGLLIFSTIPKFVPPSNTKSKYGCGSILFTISRRTRV
jgi:dual specificity protein kinase YAK1